MRHPYRAVRLVDVLTAGAACAVSIDAQVLFVDLDVHFVWLDQHRNSDSARVNAALRLRLRNSLDAVHAGFVLEDAEGPTPVDGHHDLFGSPLRARRKRRELDREPLRLRVGL